MRSTTKPRRSRSTSALADEVEVLTLRIEQLERERDAAESFAALAAHELMAPLVMTEAFVALAAERVELGIESDLMNALGSLGRTAIRTRLLVESLLHDARATVRPLEREPVELERLVHDCVALLYPEVKARSAVVSVGSLPVVRAEPALLAGLITNLLSNALKFNPRQGGAIAVHAARSDNGWEISVENEGPPIALEDRERIFEPFYRGRHERRIKGAGLGLAICRRIVERHEGRIGVAVEGDRNRFFFVLPD